MRLLTKDRVAIVEIRDGALWTLAHSVTRCRMSQVCCEAALLFVPYVTLEQLESIVRGISKYGENPLMGPETHAANFMIQKDRMALRGIARSEDGRSAWDYGRATIARLISYGFCANDEPMTITDAGRFALGPTAMHCIYAWCEPAAVAGLKRSICAGVTPASCDLAEVTCYRCQLAAEKA